MKKSTSLTSLLKNILWIVIFLFVEISCIWISDYMTISIMSIIILICSIQLIHNTGYRYTSFPMLFLIISYVFHMGNIVCTMFFLKGDFGDLFWGTEKQICVNACKFVLVSLFFFVLGVRYISNYKIKCVVKKYVIKSGISMSNQKIFLIGIIFFLVGIVPKLIVDVNKLVVGITRGYLATYDVDLSGKAGLGTLVYSGIICILIAKRKNISLCRMIIILTSVYEGIMMFSGNRYMSLSMIITMCFIYINYIEKINSKKFMLYSILIVMGLTFINTVRELRNMGINLSMFMEEYFVQLQNAPIINEMLELGGTIRTVVLSVKNFPQYADFGYGSTYWKFFLYAIPKVKELHSIDMSDMEFIRLFPYHESLGGSYLGEAYYNFGWFGVFFSCVVGMMVGGIGKRLENVEQLDKIIFCFPIILYSYFYIRGTVAVFRIALYHIVFMFVLCIFLNKLQKRGNVDLL